MFKAIKEFFLGKPAATTTDAKVEAVNAAPYKIEAPVLTEVVDTKPAKAKKAPAAKKPAVAKKPAAAKKAPAKKTGVKKSK